jgi:predicted restriction endonuclease
MSDDRDIFDRPLGNRPAHMNTFLRLHEPKTIQQLEQESGYTNVEGHIGALRKEGKVVSAGRGKGYVIDEKWFNWQSESARKKFLESCGLSSDATVASEKKAPATPKCWCVNFDHLECLQYGLESNLWMMQYQYSDPSGHEFQGGNQISKTTRMWRRMAEVNIGDRFVAYLKESRFYAIGTVISPRRKRTPADAVDDVESYVKRKDSHSRKRGHVYYTPAFYENFDDKWRHPGDRISRYAQRIDVDSWRYQFADGVSVTGLGSIPPNEIQMAVFEIDPQLFESIEAELKSASQTQARIVASDGEANNEVASAMTEIESTDYFSPANLKDERQRRVTEIVERRGQPEFRRKLVAAYDGVCAVTRCDAVAALEAAHIKPYCGPESDHVTNGLLLRADIHTLFDLDLIGIHPDTFEVALAPILKTTQFSALDGQRIADPVKPFYAPNREALIERWREFRGDREN